MLVSARELVCQLGPRAVIIDEIAAAGVGKQAIYRWWPSKSSVIMNALITLIALLAVLRPGLEKRARLADRRREPLPVKGHQPHHPSPPSR